LLSLEDLGGLADLGILGGAAWGSVFFAFPAAADRDAPGFLRS